MHDLNETVSNSIVSIIKRSGLFRTFARAVNESYQEGSLDRNLVDKVANSTWQKTINAADDAYKPGIFTTFAGYEYTSSVDLYDRYLHGTSSLKIPKIYQTVFFQDWIVKILRNYGIGWIYAEKKEWKV